MIGRACDSQTGEPSTNVKMSSPTRGTTYNHIPEPSTDIAMLKVWPWTWVDRLSLISAGSYEIIKDAWGKATSCVVLYFVV